jgi:pyridoxine 5-phosphate synthase
MTHLSVNVNKLATLRNSRGKNTPDVTALAHKILTFGTHGITIHPRPDGRHIRAHDVRELRIMINQWNAENPRIEYNIEGYPSEDFLRLVEEAHPDQATLVPDPPEAITSNAGWDLVKNFDFLKVILARLGKAGIRASLFVEPAKFDGAQERALTELKPDRIELYTEAYADAFPTSERAEVTREYLQVAEFANKHGIAINAGHDLSQANLAYLLREVPMIAEVSIGHALICEALEQGLETTVKNYLEIVKKT